MREISTDRQNVSASGMSGPERRGTGEGALTRLIDEGQPSRSPGECNKYLAA